MLGLTPWGVFFLACKSPYIKSWLLCQQPHRVTDHGGELYNTDTATYIGSYEYGAGGDFSHICETLYQKKTGELFLHGVGGANTRYGKACEDNSWGGGEAIIPQCEFDAKEWVAEHCEAEVYIKLFGDVAE